MIYEPYIIFSLSIAFVQTLLLSLVFTPLTKQLAAKLGAVDIPNNRKVHSEPTPRLGGLAIFTAIIVTLGMYYILFPHIFDYVISDSANTFISTTQGWFLAIALTIVFLLGMWDDIQTLDPAPKFAIQFVAAALIFFAGFEVDIVSVRNENFSFLISFPLTIIWIVGITNAFNLIDGLDGLASGVAIIALSTIAIISLIYNQVGIGLVSLLLCGALTGFLWYNFRPATIFLGDSGSLFLGFALASLSIESYTKTSTAFAIFIPLFALGLPIIDTLLSMIRRFFSWFMPGKKNTEDFSLRKALKSLFQPDKSHIHHQLINHGLSHKNTVLVLYVVSILFGLGALIVSITQQFSTAIWVVLFLAAVIKIGVSQLKYREIDLFHNGIFFTFYKTLVINKRHFRKFLDSLFILAAFCGSYYLLQPNLFQKFLANPHDAAIMLSSLYVVQFGILWIFGLYRETIRSLGIGDVIKIVKSVVMAVVASGGLHYLFFQTQLTFNYSAYILGFYFLGTLILGMRISFHFLKYLFYKSRKDNRRVLIYGAGEQGVLALQRLMNIAPNRFTPIGFIDEDPSLEGRVVNGFSVFGGHWKLERLIKRKKIDELHIADPDLQPEVMRRIQHVAKKFGLDIRVMRTELKNLNKDLITNNHAPENYKYVN